MKRNQRTGRYAKKKRHRGACSFYQLAEAVRFELTNPCGLPVFKTGAIDHSATLPDVFCCVAILTGQEQGLQVAEEVKTMFSGYYAAHVLGDQALALGLSQAGGDAAQW